MLEYYVIMSDIAKNTLAEMRTDVERIVNEQGLFYEFKNRIRSNPWYKKMEELWGTRRVYEILKLVISPQWATTRKTISQLLPE